MNALRTKFRLPMFLTLVLVMIIALSPVIKALADNIITDGDGVAPVSDSSLNFGTVCLGQTYTKNAAIAINRNGGYPSTNVFLNGTSVGITTGTITDAGLSATGGSITLPTNWGNQSNNTDSSSITSTVSFKPAVAGSFSGSIVFNATGKSSSDNKSDITRSGTLTVTATVSDCPPQKVKPTVSVSGGPFTYDGNPHAATVAVTGTNGDTVLGSSVVTYNGSTTAPTNAGTYNVVVAFTSSDSAYTDATESGSITINKAQPTVTVSGGPFTYDGNPHAAVVSVTGANGAVTGTTYVTYNGSTTAPTNAGTYPVDVAFTSTDSNYTDATKSGSITIAKATSTTKIIGGGTFPYDGQPHAATVSVTGAGDLSLQPAPVYSDRCSAAPTNVEESPCTASYIFVGDDNHLGSSDSVTITITAIEPTIVVTGGPFTYDGIAHPASAVATGLGGASVSGIFAYTYNGSADAPINAGTYAVVATFSSANSNYTDATGNGSIIINPAHPTVTVSGGPFIYNGTPQPATVSVTGIGGVTVSGSSVVTYNTSTTVPKNAGTYIVAVVFTSADSNYTDETGSGSITINKATLTVTADNIVGLIIGSPIPTFTASFTGFKNGENLDTSGVTGIPEFSTDYTPTSKVGVYNITVGVGTLQAINYDFNFKSGTLTVIYRWDGFLQPINDTAHQTGLLMSIFKGGSTVPVKFQLKDASGKIVQSSSALWITPVKGSPTTGIVDESLFSDPASSGNTYRWDATSQQYIFNWSTKGFATGYFWRIGVTLDDGVTHYVYIGLR